MSLDDFAGPLCRALLAHGCLAHTRAASTLAESAAQPMPGRACSSAPPELGRAVKFLDDRHLVEAVVTVFIAAGFSGAGACGGQAVCYALWQTNRVDMCRQVQHSRFPPAKQECQKHRCQAE
eukprot:2548441-Alexandrium_andersonii.AAC.1